jgi:hypothetical protein
MYICHKLIWNIPRWKFRLKIHIDCHVCHRRGALCGRYVLIKELGHIHMWHHKGFFLFPDAYLCARYIVFPIPKDEWTTESLQYGKWNYYWTGDKMVEHTVKVATKNQIFKLSVWSFSFGFGFNFLTHSVSSIDFDSNLWPSKRLSIMTRSSQAYTYGSSHLHQDIFNITLCMIHK